MLGTDQLYVVLPGNTLSKISASAAAELYGDYMVKTIAVPFWPHYVKRGTDIVSAQAHEGMLLSLNGKVWFVDAGLTLREVTDAGFTANRFKRAFVRPATASMVQGYATGSAIVGLEVNLFNRTAN